MNGVMEVLSAAFLLFLVMDPVGNLPLFICELNGFETKKKKKILSREFLVALAIMLVFLLGGRYILKMLHISDYSMGIAGGTVLFLISIKMVFPSSEEENGSEVRQSEPYIVPLAVPLLAGPSVLATLILFTAKYADSYYVPVIALIIAWVASLLILIPGVLLSQYISKKLLRALERLMGMLLTAIAVEMFVNGVRSAFNLG